MEIVLKLGNLYVTSSHENYVYDSQERKTLWKDSKDVCTGIQNTVSHLKLV